MIDVIHGKSYKSMGTSLGRTMIQRILLPCFCGLTLPTRLLVQLLGRQDCGMLLRDREVVFNEYRFHEFSFEKFPLLEVNEILSDNNLC